MIRITARVIDVNTGEVVKTVKIDGDIKEIFALAGQDRLRAEPGSEPRAWHFRDHRNRAEETQSVEAYESFSRGMINLRTGSRDSLDRAIHYFEKAAEMDPNYAGAWAALSAAYDLKGGFLSIPELSHKAVEFAEKAVKLNPRLSHAHQFLGGAYNTLGRYDEAIASMNEAVRLEPNNAGAHGSLARAYWLGKGMVDEAIAELEHAVAINPQAGYSYLAACVFAHAGRQLHARRSGGQTRDRASGEIHLGQRRSAGRGRAHAAWVLLLPPGPLRRSDSGIRTRAGVS